MQQSQPGPDAQAALQEVLGYLNFSSGTRDPKFLSNLNQLFRPLLCGGDDSETPAQLVHRWLSDELEKLHQQGGAFAEATQARGVLDLVFLHLLPAYQKHHRDLLFHQQPADLAQPYFVALATEAVLAAGGPWDEQKRIITAALNRLNDYIGYRPVAVLETDQKIEPYRHEWVRPIPLYVEGAGVAAGRYERLIEKTLEILRATDPDLLNQACFDPEALEELALDPRAYDFDHPVNKRPNYHFGQWDPHRIDNRGRYRRFVLQQVTLDALLARAEEPSEVDYEERLFEAAAVLSGTVLMASGVSGAGPDTHDSTVSLSTLLPQIAGYRDAFYQQLLARLEGPMAERLLHEEAKLHQPFGGARQHLNHALARLRAKQLCHVHLAQLFARMGYPDAATRQAHTVKVPSARILCEIYCRLTLGHRAIDARNLERASQCLPEVEALLQRGIGCGALVDPWNIVGFGGNFSLFPALENSIHDYRVDTLIELMEQIFALCARGWSEAAAQDDETLEEQFATCFSRMASWWDQFATPTVTGIKRLVGKELEVSTNLVAGALNAWHKAGAAAGDIKFWSMFVDQFDSPKAFQLVVEALMEKGDHVASMALLMQWLSQAERIPLADGDSSFHRLALRWLHDAELAAHEEGAAGDGWPLVHKFFDYFEANADQFWQVPNLELPQSESQAQDLLERILGPEGDAPEEEEDPDHLFSAAYEEMTYRDSTDDGIEGEMLEFGAGSSDFELEDEAKRLGCRLELLSTLAQLWKNAAGAWGAGPDVSSDRWDVFEAWQRRAAANQEGLLRLLDSTYQHAIPTPSGDHDSLVEYDRRRLIKEGLMERIVSTAIETAHADRILKAVGRESSDAEGPDVTVELFRAMFSRDARKIRQLWPDFIAALCGRPILYVPLSKGGDPATIVAARIWQEMLRDLLAWLPRLGLIQETCELLETVQTIESEHPVGPGAVTEFDRLFETGHRAVVECIVVSSEAWADIDGQQDAMSRAAAGRLVECLQQLTESQLRRWLRHSRTLRLSVVEKLADEKSWQSFVRFVEHHGSDLFTQKFLNLSNIRGILHQGVDTWLARLEEDPHVFENVEFIEQIGTSMPRQDFVRNLTVGLEAVVENYHEYRDYNSTTTQSDRGELFYTFVDFLRLRAEYDRIAWNLRPVVLAHQVVVQRGCDEAAAIWRRALAERTSEEADRRLQRLAGLSQEYGMRLPTIAHRIGERFVQPLAMDRIRALVQPAMTEAAQGTEGTTFALLQAEIRILAEEPAGVGFDLPAWLVALEEEVGKVRQHQRQEPGENESHHRIPQVKLSWQDVQRQLDEIQAAEK